jgi:omega-amidase
MIASYNKTLKSDLNLAIFQLDLAWEDAASNRGRIDLFLSNLHFGTDIVFLPEMFPTGFSMNVSQMAESMDGETIQWMKDRCRQYHLAICGSLIIREDAKYYNRLVFVEPSGNIQYYNKRHLFTMGNEENYFEPGMERLIVKYKGWRICTLICYDLRFPVWARNRNEYDILVYSANWPQARTEVWNTLLKARAIENQAYVVGANRVGVDGNGIGYSGNSQLIDAKGNIISEIDKNTEGIIIGTCSWGDLEKFRSDFPVLNDADSFEIV